MAQALEESKALHKYSKRQLRLPPENQRSQPHGAHVLSAKERRTRICVPLRRYLRSARRTPAAVRHNVMSTPPPTLLSRSRQIRRVEPMRQVADSAAFFSSSQPYQLRPIKDLFARKIEALPVPNKSAK
jgi:hypothetical protein